MPMMKCGHKSTGYLNGEPFCIICYKIKQGATEVDQSPPSLEGRTAICWQCGGSEILSKESLPFFRHRTDSKYDSYYCGCRGWD